MQILLTNDDGPFSPGLHALRAALARLGEVTVVCPADERSGVSHAITYLVPVRSATVRLPDGAEAVTLSGTPADCVKFGLAEVLDGPADLVVSGPNLGWNLGVDLFYSGTVAAALEGGINGVRSVAFSAGLCDAEQAADVADVAVGVLERLLAEELPAPWVFAVTIPPLDGGAPPPLRFTAQSPVLARGRYERGRSRRRHQSWLVWDASGGDHPDGSDVAAVAAGCVSVTPLRLGMTDAAALEALDARASNCATRT